VKTGSVDLFILWRDTNQKLESLSRRVREGKSLDLAHEFVTYLLASGLLNLLDAHAHRGPLRCDGVSIRRKAERLREKITERYSERNEKPEIERADLERILTELGELRAIVKGVRVPVLRVVKGGNDE